MFWLACFCWIKYIPPIPAYHLRVFLLSLFSICINPFSAVNDVGNESLDHTDTSAAPKNHHHLWSQHCCLLGPLPCHYLLGYDCSPSAPIAYLPPHHLRRPHSCLLGQRKESKGKKRIREPSINF